MKKFVVFVAAVAALLVGQAAPASAAGTVSGGSLLALAGIDQAGVLATFTCAALTDDVATDVRVSSCELRQNGVAIATAFPIGLPGVIAATAQDQVVDVGTGPLEVCWTVDATFLDTTTATQSGCGRGFLS